MTTLADRAYDAVEALIVGLDLPPGTVFSEGELSERVGIGRTPLREALQRLAHEGLVEALPRRGIRVTDVDLVGAQALVETRRVLDRLLVTAAARRATPPARERLAACAEAVEVAAASGDRDAYLRADHDGDAALADASRNPFAARALAPLHAHSRRLWALLHHDDADLDRAAAHHAAMLRAAASGDETAAAAAVDALLDDLAALTHDALALG